MSDPAPLRRLAPVDLDTGEVVHPEIAALQERIASLEDALKEAEKDLRVKRGQLTKARKDLVKERLDYARRDDVKAVMDYWNRRMGRDLALTADRFDAIRGLLDETRIRVVDGKARKTPAYEFPADFKRAIDGAWFDAFETKRKNGTVKRHDDITLICRSGAKFEEFMARSPFPA
jgi:ribosomal protein S15P/S13E